MAARGWKFVAAALCLAGAPAFSALPAPGVASGGATLVDGGRQVSLARANEDGRHALRLQDAQGRIVRELDLAGFLPAAYVQALPRDDRGLRWWREAKLDRANHRVDFSVPVPGSAAGATGPALHFSIDLRDGAVRTAQIREYLAAADRARALAAGAMPSQGLAFAQP